MDELVEVLEQLTAQPPRLPRTEQELKRVSRRRRKRRRAIAASLSVVSLIGVGVGAALLNGTGQPDIVTANGSGSRPSVTTPGEHNTDSSSQRPSDDPLTVDPLDVDSLDIERLVAELEAAGATVTQSSPDQIDGSVGLLTDVWSGEPATLCVNGIQVQLMEYETVDDRERDSATITIEGQIEGPGFGVIAEWVGQPRFFAAGRLIAFYSLKDDPATLDLLTKTLGPTLSPDGYGTRGAPDPPCP